VLLAGDIGGTKAALGVFCEEQGVHTDLAESEVHSADYPSLESIAKEFLAKAGLKVRLRGRSKSEREESSSAGRCCEPS
jgi:glucokinase